MTACANEHQERGLPGSQEVERAAADAEGQQQQRAQRRTGGPQRRDRLEFQVSYVSPRPDTLPACPPRGKAPESQPRRGVVDKSAGASVENSNSPRYPETVSSFATPRPGHGHLRPDLRGPERDNRIGPSVPGSMSERTTPLEGPVSGRHRPRRLASRAMTVVGDACMKPWEQLEHYAGFDWARDHHDVIVVNRAGAVVADFRFADTAEGWMQFREEIARFASVGIAIETSRGASVERLLSLDVTVYPIHPMRAERYRERKSASGVKSDRLDAWALADALRLDGQTWKALRPEDPILAELRQLCRDERALIADRTAKVNQLRQALQEYYPAALEAFDDWTKRGAWAFIVEFPTPEELVRAGKRKWEKFLHSHRLYREETYQHRLDCFARAMEFHGTPATTAAKKRLAVALAKVLRTFQEQIDLYEERIQEVFRSHPDHDLFGSLPGAGTKTAPRLLGEIGSDRGRFETPEALQCYAGTAPVTCRSGNTKHVKLRQAANKELRFAVHWLADLSRGTCTWAAIYYRKKRDEGKSHACALRCLGQRWMKILWKMWQTRTPYDADLHQKNQVGHGSWVLQLVTPPQA